MDVKEFLALKEGIEAKKSAFAKLQGKRELLEQRLEKEFSCRTVEEARKLLVTKEKQLEQRESSFQDELERFKEEYDTLLQR